MKRLSMLLTLLLTAPLAGQDVNLPHTFFTLTNGLRVIVHEDHSAPIAAVNVWYHVGSAYEEVGRTGFAHLFEHVMFEGSANVPRGEFDRLLEGAGGVNNGSTNPDRTNYYEMVPSNAVELALWLEADRMGHLLETMSQEKLDIQRDVVKNERRQRYENQPYGMFFEVAFDALYPDGHPYSWSTIGSMEDLTAATLADVESFFRRYYVPNNAVLVVAGDVEPDVIRQQVERFFGGIPAGDEVEKPDVAIPPISETRYVTLEDRVTLPQLNIAWRARPFFSEDDAALDVLAQILGNGKNSRLFRRLIYDDQIAQDVTVFNNSQLLSGDFFIRVTGREGLDLNQLEEIVLEEVQRIASTPPTQTEMDRVLNGLETSFVSSLEQSLGKADQLNLYYYYTGDPDYAAEDLARYRSLTPADIQAAAREYLLDENRVVISIVPQGETGLAAERTASR
jgi:zinc protease